MNNLLPVLGLAYAAFWIWLGVRIFNRRERWAIRAAVAALVVTVPVAGFCLLFPAVSTPHEVYRRSQCKNNLKQIGLALHNYHDKYGCLPPAHIADENGRPMHSWRVLILPFLDLDQQRLCEKYPFDEPWDGPNNRKLADTIVHVYNCPSDDRDGRERQSATTNYVVVVGPETAWPETGTVTMEDFVDGTSNTLLVVEVSNSGYIGWSLVICTSGKCRPGSIPKRAREFPAGIRGAPTGCWLTDRFDSSRRCWRPTSCERG